MNTHSADIKPNTLDTQGVASWSQPFIWQDFVIFCCGNDTYKEAAFTTWANGNGHWFKSLIGSYAGKTERSFMMTLEAFQEEGIAEKFCKQEESILVLGVAKSSDMHLPAKLVFLGSGNEVPLGNFKEASAKKAKASIGWTYDPMTCKHYICE